MSDQVLWWAEDGGARDDAQRQATRAERRILDLVTRAQGGDRRAFERLWSGHRRVAHAILLTRVPGRDAEDLLIAHIGGMDCCARGLKAAARMMEDGELAFTDVAVDPMTGSYALRVLVPNPDNLLMPGMYVRAILSNAVLEKGILVPQQGITRNSTAR